MRTTVTLDDQLLRRAKEIALASNRSLGSVIDDALRAAFAERATPNTPVVLPIYGGSGLRPGVDLEDKEALAALLDEPEWQGELDNGGQRTHPPVASRHHTPGLDAHDMEAHPGATR